MHFKKYIAAVFIIFSLTFSFSNVSFSQNPKPAIVYIIGSGNDNTTEGFIKNNEALKKKILTGLSIKIFLLNSIPEKVYFNSS